jgi:eukaryotic-like serine/threonine-protein kinase
MTREQWQSVRKILEQALELAPEDCARFLDESCSGDPELRAEVESLLAANEQASGDFLTGKALDYASEMAGDPAPGDTLQGRRIGAYQVLEEIGHGGMGTVYRAVRADDQFRKQVAIKVVRGGLGDEFAIQRFRAERQILANLDHANIARLLDGGATEDGRPYVVMEYIQGQSIDDYADSHKLSVRERLELFRTVCSAVAFAHQRLVIHRDIKPGNILVTQDAEPKLLDFGIAKILDDEPRTDGSEATVTMVRLMTPEYASPEQVRGELVTTATDVYSLGVVLYALLTGRRPYRVTSRSPHDIVQAVLETEPEKPSTAVNRAEDKTAEAVSRTREGSPEKLRRRLRGDLDNIVLKALRKEPERRYASVEQFSEDIRRHLEGLPVSARPVTLAYRGSKFVRRHRWAVIAAGLAVLALLGGLAATMREAYIARIERQRAEQRFTDVRRLANSLLFEVYDAIENLPGATPARKILVDRALQYLDKLAAEARGDLSLQRELASAYERVGDVQGGFRSSNLGDTAGFMASYRKALAIREAVLRGEPDSVDAQRELLRTHGRMSDALMASGDLKGSIEQLRQLLPIAEKLSAADPSNLTNRRNLALAYLDYGWKRSGPGDWKGSLADCRKAVGMLGAVSAADPADKRTKRVLAIAYSRVGELLSTFGHQHSESLAVHKKALGIEDALLNQDPRNTDIRRMEAWDTLRTGEEILALGNVAEGLEKYGDALAKAEGLSEADPKSVQFHTDIASILARMGAAHLAQGNGPAALAELQRSLSEINTFSQPGELDVDALEVKSQDQFRIGKVYALLASERKRPSRQRAEYWRQAAAWFERAIPTLAEARARGALQGDDGAMLAEAKAEGARCTEQLGQLEAANRR